MNVTVTVNGQDHALTAVAPHESLLHLLRERLGLTGTKNACEEGACGACTVQMDGRPVYACLVPGMQLDGAHVTTVEGLAGDAGLSAIQRSFLTAGAVQCGFCIPGMLISADRLLATSPQPDERDIRTALAGNLCRCTGYQKIVEAVLLAARLRRARSETNAPHKLARGESCGDESMRIVVVSDRRISAETLVHTAAAMPGVTVVGSVMQLSDAIRYCETDQADVVIADGDSLRPAPSPPLAALGLPEDPVRFPVLADALHRSQNAYADLVPRVEQLSKRELQVFSLLGIGLSNRRISAVLAIGERTVKTFVGHILAKLGLESRLQAGLAAAALANRGMVPPRRSGRRRPERRAGSSPDPMPLAPQASGS